MRKDEMLALLTKAYPYDEPALHDIVLELVKRLPNEAPAETPKKEPNANLQD